VPAFDVIVVGLGAVGSAALRELARRGVRVLGIDRFSPPHALGSSHGETRITRLAIGEGAHYTPLAMRSHAIWRELERETGADLLTQCGGLIVSGENKSSFTHVEGFFRNTVNAARRYGIAHELLDARQIQERYPCFSIRDDEFGYFEPGAGFVRPEACIAAQLRLAQDHGAELHRNETVLEFHAERGSVGVVTDRASYRADSLIIAAGAWLPQLLGADYVKLFRIYRQLLCWFAVDESEAFAPARFPVFIWELSESRQGIYGFPVLDAAGLKIATEQYAQSTTPQQMQREVGSEEIAAMYRDYVAPYIRGVSARCTKAVSCLYTVTPDAGFVIDRLAAAERIIVASCCSGHGFKHSAAIGEALAEMAQGRQSTFDLSPFSLGRFS